MVIHFFSGSYLKSWPNYNNAGVCFYIGGKKSEWNALTAKEQIKMLNAWTGMYELFYRFLKDED